jgi:hypothetical protein
VADLQPDIPERADQPLQALPLVGTRFVGQQHQQVDVGARVKLAAAVAAGGYQRGIGEAGLAPQLRDGAVDELRVTPQQQPRSGLLEVGLAQRLPGRGQLAAHG